MNRRIADPKEKQSTIREYYRNAGLWLPENPSHRIFKVESLNKDGSTNFYRIRDRINDIETLRTHLIRTTPINVYYSVSTWLNPTKTGKKTYKKDNDGRTHGHMNGFMYSDAFIDCDHMTKSTVKDIEAYVQRLYNTDQTFVVYSGGGYHVNIRQAFRYNTDEQWITDPIEREKQCEKDMKSLAWKLREQDYAFDNIIQAIKGDIYINSPTIDTRRIHKLPQTLTKYGTVSCVVNNIDTFNPKSQRVSERLDAVQTYKPGNLESWISKV